MTKLAKAMFVTTNKLLRNNIYVQLIKAFLVNV